MGARPGSDAMQEDLNRDLNEMERLIERILSACQPLEGLEKDKAIIEIQQENRMSFDEVSMVTALEKPFIDLLTKREENSAEINEILAEYGPKRISGQGEKFATQEQGLDNSIDGAVPINISFAEAKRPKVVTPEIHSKIHPAVHQPQVYEVDVQEVYEAEAISSEKKPLWRRLLPWAVDLLLAAIMITATLMFLQNDDPHKNIFGYRYYFIESGSMEPELPMQSFILVKMMNAPEEIHVGDNVAFYFLNSLAAQPEFWTHKVIEIIHEAGNTKFQTKGVANPSPDPFVLDSENVIGKVVYCNKYIGPFMMFAAKNPLPLLAVVAAFFVFLHVVGKFIRNREPRAVI